MRGIAFRLLLRHRAPESLLSASFSGLSDSLMCPVYSPGLFPTRWSGYHFSTDLVTLRSV